jgi:polyphosphate kinase 2 (PPK2 family)
VHPELLARQKLPAQLAGKDIWRRRFEDIRAFEHHLERNGTLVLKFFLNVSKDEQRKRFLDRIDDPGKRWKFSMTDVAECKLWPKYMAAYQDMIRNTSTPEAPWFVVPADHKWFTRIVVAAALVQGLESLGLNYPKVTDKALKELKMARKALKAEK